MILIGGSHGFGGPLRVRVVVGSEPEGYRAPDYFGSDRFKGLKELVIGVELLEMEVLMGREGEHCHVAFDGFRLRNPNKGMTSGPKIGSDPGHNDGPRRREFGKGNLAGRDDGRCRSGFRGRSRFDLGLGLPRDVLEIRCVFFEW